MADGNLRRIKLLLEYCGTRYHGWQVQPQTPTVQGSIEACLSRITNAPVRLQASGRTDAGVHARGQVAHCDIPARIPAATLLRALNSLLPDDIVVRQITDVPEDFHARYSAYQKTYVYLILNRPVSTAFLAPYVWHIPQPLDVTAMQSASQALLGEHDFSAFRAASCAAKSPVRCLYRLRIKRHRGCLVVVLCANGFLQHMARNIVGTLVAIGRGARPARAMQTILQSRQRQLAAATAPAQGLCLLRVRYPASASTQPLASCKSAISKPSLNQ